MLPQNDAPTSPAPDTAPDRFGTPLSFCLRDWRSWLRLHLRPPRERASPECHPSAVPLPESVTPSVGPAPRGPRPLSCGYHLACSVVRLIETIIHTPETKGKQEFLLSVFSEHSTKGSFCIRPSFGVFQDRAACSHCSPSRRGVSAGMREGSSGKTYFALRRGNVCDIITTKGKIHVQVRAKIHN